ncbi:MAG: hypothetical protein ACREAZ_04590, partial [Nitrososphaera sp.]
MAFNPSGKIVASSVPAGVFETFAGWPTNDWLGTTSFSEGGAFYFSQNSGNNSTLLLVPVNQTGVYAVLLHNTLFHGKSLYEPVQVEAKFSTLLPDNSAPMITVNLPNVVGIAPEKIPVTITEENFASWTYAVDAGDPIRTELTRDGTSGDSDTFEIILEGAALSEGMHRIRIDSSDLVGHSTSYVSSFEVDRTPPSVEILVKTADSIQLVLDKLVLSKDAEVSWNVTDKNGAEGPVTVSLPDYTSIQSEVSSSVFINSSSLEEGSYPFSILAYDGAGNNATRNVGLIVDRMPPGVSLSFVDGTSNVKGTTRILLDAADANLKSTMLVIEGRKTVNVTGMNEYELDTTEMPDGKYSIKLVAADHAGN